MSRLRSALICLFLLTVACRMDGLSEVRLVRAARSHDAHALEEFSKRRAMNHVRKLAGDIGVRVRTTKGERKAAQYIAAKLESFGYLVEIGKFDVDGSRSRNVNAVWPEAVDHPFVIGAHMDTVSGSPGANDNASGVAVMLEMARVAAGTSKASLIRFVAFGSEEYGADGRHHVGSQKFVKRQGEKGRKRLPGMISIDMVAKGRPLIIATAGIGPPIVARKVHKKMDQAGFNVVRQTTCDCSDNGPFERAGIPAAFVWSGSEPNHHEPTDTVANLSKRDLRRTGRAVHAFVAELNKRLLRMFRKR
jgi:Zn-dependent M28 family amino/carboxypeptidase